MRFKNFKELLKNEKTHIFSILSLVLSLVSLTACAQQAEIVKTQAQAPIQVAPQIPAANDWQNWSLVVVTLDKNQKPSEKTEVSLGKPVKLSKPKAPEISIEEIPQSEMLGRVLRIKCEDNISTQKFETTEQLKGWAVQMSCYKQTYYFIINSNKLS